MTEKITLTTGQADDLLNSPAVYNAIKRDLPVKTSMALAMIIDKLPREMKVYFEKKQQLVKEYAIKDKSGKAVCKPNSKDIDFGANEAKVQDIIKEVRDINLSLDMIKVEIDPEKVPAISTEEILALLPIIKLKEEHHAD